VKVFAFIEYLSLESRVVDGSAIRAGNNYNNNINNNNEIHYINHFMIAMQVH